MKIKEERIELEKMISNSSDETGKDSTVSSENIGELETPHLIDVDLSKLKIQCEKEARRMIKNAISFMIPINMIRENKYLKDKFNVDVMSLAGMIYQLRSNEIVQKSLIEEISRGASHPRMYEVYTGMSKTIGELNKQMIQTVEALKETYRSFKEDVKERQNEELGSSNKAPGILTAGDGSVVTRGTKELINRVKQVKSQRSLDNVKIIDDAHIISNDIILGDIHN